ncbi:germination protein M [Paenibacillus forsythiae]|uniref:Germination protein M n=1 Tax=Paenibacillus forsythiae TaxID=365616 RepID=A0ABU3HHF9_9BACL|nr:GerMN domain-containing protein [Paenibacillus forsythiae]MDT3429105.1 germination protein M [Paenibacillus forsythiae]
MKNKQKLALASAACLLAFPLVLSGCGWFGSDQSAAIDPPPGDVEEQMLQTSGNTLDTGVFAPVAEDGADKGAAVNGSDGGTTDSGAAANNAAAGSEKAASTGDSASTAARTTVFLQNDNGLLAPVALRLPESGKDGALKQSLEALVDGGAYSADLPDGFHGVLPQGTEVKSVTVDHNLAVAELGGKFGTYAPADERKLMEAITWTLTGQEGIKGVQLSIDGKKLNEMPLKGTPLDRPLTRSIGINLPSQGPVSMNFSAVTVYFSAASPGGVQYYVPVTRFVTPGQDTLKAAMNELIEGPDSENGLETVMTQETTLDSVEKGQNGVVTVSLNDDMFDDGSQVPAELLESVVLTVAQNSDDSLVQVRMNGKQTVTGTDNVDYGKPVSAPEYVNELPL